MNKINYVTGDATEPVGDGIKIIAHICNNIGAWGAGFVLALSRKWSDPEDSYRAMSDYQLGTVRVINIPQAEDILVANMIAQNGIGPDDGIPPIRYVALMQALTSLNQLAVQVNASLHMPRIGAGLAGGDWNLIEKIIEECTTVPVTVYDLPA